MTDTRLWLMAIASCFVLVIVIVVVMPQFRAGIRVTIQNTGTTQLHSVVLHVTGGSYKLGNITPGASSEVVIKSTGESNLEIEFEGNEGRTQRLNAGGYFESGYRGTIRVSIKDGTIDKNEQDIHVW